MYIVGFLLPYLVQMFSQDNHTVKVSIAICMVTQIIFFMFELTQIKVSTWKEYIGSRTNLMDLAYFLMFTYFAINRFFDGQSMIPGTGIRKGQKRLEIKGEHVILIICNIIIIM